jgi:hypothetical protein
MKKTKISFAYVFLKVTFRCFKCLPSICISWINCVIFFIFCAVRLTSAQLPLSPLFFLIGAASPTADIITPSHCVMLPSFLLSKDELTASASSFGNGLSHRLPSWAKTKTLHLHNHCKLPFSDRPTRSLYCYKKIISILVILPTTQSRLYFTSF